MGAAYDLLCQATACYGYFMPANTSDDVNHLCFKDTNGSWCAPKATEAEKILADTVGMDNAAIAAKYMNSPILCNDCMSQYESMMNATEKMLYSLVCPNAEPPTAPTGQPTS